MEILLIKFQKNVKAYIKGYNVGLLFKIIKQKFYDNLQSLLMLTY